jgi:hypothetical protein
MISKTIPLEPVLDRRYFKMKPYLDEFIDEVEAAKVDPSKYEVVVTLHEIGSLSPSDFTV